MCVPSGLGDMSTVVFFPSKHQSRRDDTLFFSLPDRGCFRWYDRHGLEPQHALPFGLGNFPECCFTVCSKPLLMQFICAAPREVKNPPLAELGVGFM